MESYQMVAKTLAGLEEVAITELKEMGAKQITRGKRAVYFTGTDDLMFKANLMLRSALSVLIPIADFEARDENELYREVLAFSWEQMFSLNHTFSVQATVSGEAFRHSKYVALKVKDGIADRFRNKLGRRPNVDPQHADYQFNLHIHGYQCSLSLNSSGVSLDKRGYRTTSNEAPINESLAAGIILKSGWKGTQSFFDPMSGSGTFGIEAAMIAASVPPGLHRSFGFEQWADFDKTRFLRIKEELSAGIREPESDIFCRDILTQNINIIAQNAEKAGVADFLRIRKEDFFQSSSGERKGFVFLNPPYGERLKQDGLASFYKSIGDRLKKNYPDCEAWVISSNIEAMKAFGLKPALRERVFNGGLECVLNKYVLY